MEYKEERPKRKSKSDFCLKIFFLRKDELVVAIDHLLHIVIRMSTSKLVKIVGNTFPVKDQLRALGAKWNVDEKCWYIASDKEAEANAIIAGSGTKTMGARSGSFRPRKCVVCGAVAQVDRRGYPIVKIYRSGECADCYEERKMGY